MVVQSGAYKSFCLLSPTSSSIKYQVRSQPVVMLAAAGRLRAYLRLRLQPTGNDETDVTDGSRGECTFMLSVETVNCLAIAEMGDRLATKDIGRNLKMGERLLSPFPFRELGRHLTHCRLGRGLL